MTFLEALHSGRILVSDGAMGTELQRRGLPSGACPEEFNVSHPDVVQAIHADYYTAGADLVETNSFGGHRPRLSMHGYEHRVAEFGRKAAQLACEVCPPGKFVAGSVGPTGDLLEPLGTRTVGEAYDMFAELASALAEGGVHVFFVETMMALEEAEVAVLAAKEKTGLPVAATMTFEKGNAGLRTMWGVDIPSAVQRLTDAGADAIGANCGKGFDEMVEIIAEMRPLTKVPIVAQANAGIPEWENGRSVYKETPDIIAPKAIEIIRLGVNVIGGCCGTGPSHIRTIRELVDDRQGKRR